MLYNSWNHKSSQLFSLQRIKSPLPPVCLSMRSGGGLTGVFLIWWRLHCIRWAHGPWRWICSSWMPVHLTNTSPSTHTTKHLLHQTPWTHPPSPFFTTKPWRLALCAPLPSTSTLPPVLPPIQRLGPGVAYRILHQMNREGRLLTLADDEATHNKWGVMKSRWGEGEGLNVNMSSV